ncbi:MAG: rod shape-determining protein MreB [Cellvibrionaceae bacterium]|jgi:rod shape-determining protein MreB
MIEAIGNSVKVLGKDKGHKIVNHFSHPRLSVNDFQLAEKVLMHAIRVLHKNKLFAPSPRIIVQPMEKLEGGITEIEKRVFRELCLGAGAREVFIHTGAELSIYNIDFDHFKNERK